MNQGRRIKLAICKRVNEKGNWDHLSQADSYLAELKDPRAGRNREHLLEEILLMAVAAVSSGAESWVDMEEWGEAKRD